MSTRIKRAQRAADSHPAIVSHRKAVELLSSRGYKRGVMSRLPNGDVAAVLDGGCAYDYSRWRLLRYEDVRAQFNALDFYKFFKGVCAEVDRQRKERQKSAETLQISIYGLKWANV